MGDWWKALEVEFNFPEPSLAMAVRTDSPSDLPMKVWCKTYGGVWEEVGVNGSSPGVVELVPALQCHAVRVRWEDTDLHKCGGLSSARSGGGLHAEILGAFSTSPPSREHEKTEEVVFKCEAGFLPMV